MWRCCSWLETHGFKLSGYLNTSYEHTLSLISQNIKSSSNPKLFFVEDRGRCSCLKFYSGEYKHEYIYLSKDEIDDDVKELENSGYADAFSGWSL